MRILVAPAIALALLAAACSGSGVVPPTPAAAPTATAPPSPTATSTPDRVVTIAAVGDVMLGRNLTGWMEERGAFYPFERIATLLQDADLTVANLEVALTERGEPQDKAYLFRAPPRFAVGLAKAGIDVVSLANNHVADYGREGVEDTLAALDQIGVLHAGAGLNEAAALRPAFADVDGLRIAFLAYTDILRNTFASGDNYGVAQAQEEAIAAGVRAAREQADVVVVMLHSGTEYATAPNPAQRGFARAAIDAGALLVLGHHPHVLQGWERYGGGLIVYSLGDFVFDLEHDPRNVQERAFETVVLYVTLTVDEILEVRPEPVVIDLLEDRPRPPTPAEAAEILGRLDALQEIAQAP
ncbi:MAG: CapA family protein [Chloroflexi bacterium]|nr:CapA family protein [Chloroflexota bacterium]